MRRPERLLFALDLTGTFVFAIGGAIAAIGADLDFFGIMVLSFATALAGGIIRDLLIGAVPPQSLRDWRYAATAFTAGLAIFFLHRLVPPPALAFLTIVDAAGLALFAVAGTEKALAFGISPILAPLLGTITAVGGGTLRDMLLAQIPVVLRADIYATAALVGSAVLVIARRCRLSHGQAALAGGAVCFAFRLIAVSQHWNLPRAIGH